MHYENITQNATFSHRKFIVGETLSHKFLIFKKVFLSKTSLTRFWPPLHKGQPICPFLSKMEPKATTMELENLSYLQNFTFTLWIFIDFPNAVTYGYHLFYFIRFFLPNIDLLE